MAMATPTSTWPAARRCGWTSWRTRGTGATPPTRWPDPWRRRSCPSIRPPTCRTLPSACPLAPRQTTTSRAWAGTAPQAVWPAAPLRAPPTTQRPACRGRRCCRAPTCWCWAGTWPTPTPATRPTSAAYSAHSRQHSRLRRTCTQGGWWCRSLTCPARPAPTLALPAQPPPVPTPGQKTVLQPWQRTMAPPALLSQAIMTGSTGSKLSSDTSSTRVGWAPGCCLRRPATSLWRSLTAGGYLG
mmetsp:Transcript_20942/g.63041  ORF Transcript_20942/g.63041 Transcript_20942/m.63041 type:complete len:242 (+) Transcript_20942:2-727(+)